MTNVQISLFPTLSDVMILVRSIVNDTFKGVTQTPGEGRIFTDDASFTLPFLNSAIRKTLRALRNEGCTFPIRDFVNLGSVPPVVQADPAVSVSIGFEGTFNGQTTSSTPVLPGDCMQVYVVRQRVTGSNLQFAPMIQAQEGLPSAYQNQWMGMWEWRNYKIYMNGSLQATDIMIRYQSGQPPINVPVESFDTTPIYLIDCQEAIANHMAAMYGRGRGADKEAIDGVLADAATAIDEMALEYIRRGQTVTYRREDYQGGGSNNIGNTSVGTTGVTS